MLDGSGLPGAQRAKLAQRLSISTGNVFPIHSARDFAALPTAPSEAHLYLVVRWGRPDIDDLIEGLERWLPSPHAPVPAWTLVGLIGHRACRFNPISKDLVDDDAETEERLGKLYDNAYPVLWSEQEADHALTFTPPGAAKITELHGFYLAYDTDIRTEDR